MPKKTTRSPEINLIKRLCGEKILVLLRNIKEDLNKVDGKTPKRLLTSILPRFLYKFNTIPFNIPKDLFIKASIS